MDKSALVIGGSSGIGKATANKLAEQGFNLTIIHRDRRQASSEFVDHGESLRKQYNVNIHTFNVDATNERNIHEVIDQCETKHFDLVVHAVSRGNLGNLHPGETGQLSQIDLQMTIDAMAMNVNAWAKILSDRNKIGNESRFITLSSEGTSKVLPGYGAVAMAKSALEILTKYLAVEYASRGVRFNCVIAGVVDTPSLRMIPNSEEIIEKAQKRNPYKRLTLPEDVANAISLLATPEASWINGATLHVDGGEHLI